MFVPKGQNLKGWVYTVSSQSATKSLKPLGIFNQRNESYHLTTNLLIIDGLNFFRRIYEANPAPDTKEKAQGAIRAATASLARALKETRPSHAFFAFDAGGQTWRHQLYSGYKQHRKPMPLELQLELTQAKQTMAANGWHIVEIPGVEADDVMASAAKLAEQDGANVVVLTTDKDAVSLVSKHVVVRDHFNRVWRDEAWCIAKFGVTPVQLLDYLALTGDPVDGIPGVAKVGPKTATRLLNQYGTLENVLAHAELIPGIVGQNLKQQADIARLSRKLTELKLDVFNVELDWAAMAKFK